MANVEFIFIASPLLGHIMQSIEMAKVLVQSDEDQKLYITFLIMKLPFDPADPGLVDLLAAAPLLPPMAASGSTTSTSLQRVRSRSLVPPIEGFS